MSKKMKIKVSPLFTKADTVRDTVTGITFTSSSWVEVDVKDLNLVIVQVCGKIGEPNRVHQLHIESGESLNEKYAHFTPWRRRFRTAAFLLEENHGTVNSIAVRATLTTQVQWSVD